MPAPRHALFPASVTLADGTVHDPVRVATDTAGITHAWKWDGGPVEVGAWPATELTRDDGGGPSRRPLALRAPDGTRLAITKSCGCGHPLKSWRPALVAPRG